MKDLDFGLIMAAARCDYESCRKILAQGANVNAADGEGQTALHAAANAESAETCAVLIEAGANVNAQNKYGRTPMHYATSTHTFTALVERGADPFLIPEGAELSYLTPLQSLVNYSSGDEFKDGVQIVLFCLERFGTGIIRQRTLDGRTLADLAQPDAELKALLLSKTTEMVVADAIDDSGSEPASTPVHRSSGPSPL